MKTRAKTYRSLLTLTLIAFAFMCDASQASDRSKRSDARDIRACIVEISKNADYAGASRVMHWVVGLKQRNVEELEVRIETYVYEDRDAEPVKEYTTSCVTGALGGLVRFRMREPGLSAG